MIGLILAVSAVPLGAVLFLNLWKGIPIYMLTKDPSSAAGAPFYVGFFSQLGIFAWSAAAAVCLFSSRTLSKSIENREISEFLFVSGLLTLVLAFDDGFLLHEKFFPRLGIPEFAIYTGYIIFMLYYVVRYYQTIIKTDFIFLLMALFFLGISVTWDLLEPPGLDPNLFEDGTKFVGIVSWLSYFFLVGTNAITGDPGQEDARGQLHSTPSTGAIEGGEVD